MQPANSAKDTIIMTAPPTGFIAASPSASPVRAPPNAQPNRTNRLNAVASPAADRAVITADGPGITVTAKPASRA